MSFKEYDSNYSFMDLELGHLLGSSRTHRFLSSLDNQIDW